MKTFFLNICWAASENIIYFYLLVPVFFILIFRFYKVQKMSKLLAPAKNRLKLLQNFSVFRRALKAFLFFTGMTFLCLVLLKPQWDKKDQEVAQEGRDLLIALDISRSMLAQDMSPDRLEFAKEKITKLLHNLSCERVGLILFAGTTVMQCPLTTDYSAFFMFLDQIDIDTISSGTTAIDQAIKEAISVFEETPTKKTKLLFVFTDGEDFSTDLSGVKDKAANIGVSIFTIGVGTEYGAPVPKINKQGYQVGFEKDEFGGVVMSRLNEDVLKDLSEQSGGKYVHAVETEDDIKFLIRETQKFEKDKFADKKFGAMQEQYPYFAAVSLACLILEWIL